MALKDSFKIPPSSYSSNTNCTRYNFAPSYSTLIMSRPSSSIPTASNNMGLSKLSSSSANPSRSNTISSASTNTKPASRKFTAAELRERRLQGLCYYCNEKYNPTYNCRSQCLALLTREDHDDLLPTSLQAITADEEPTTPVPKVSFNALIGEYHPMTLRLKGSNQNRMVNILVDNGSSCNFIKPCVSNKLALLVSIISPFKVFVGSEDFIWC